MTTGLPPAPERCHWRPTGKTCSERGLHLTEYRLMRSRSASAKGAAMVPVEFPGIPSTYWVPTVEGNMPLGESVRAETFLHFRALLAGVVPCGIGFKDGIAYVIAMPRKTELGRWFADAARLIAGDTKSLDFSKGFLAGMAAARAEIADKATAYLAAQGWDRAASVAPPGRPKSGLEGPVIEAWVRWYKKAAAYALPDIYQSKSGKSVGTVSQFLAACHDGVLGDIGFEIRRCKGRFEARTCARGARWVKERQIRKYIAAAKAEV